MDSNVVEPVYRSTATLWDGKIQLPGILELWESEIIFHVDGFTSSHLNLWISLSEIEKVEEFLIYDLARNGLLILTRNEKRELFVIEDVSLFIQKLRSQLKAIQLTGREPG